MSRNEFRREGRVATEMKPAPGAQAPAWMKRLGVGGFLFFLVKGLLWLLVPAVLTVAGLS